ncbi:hypothetical protein NC653_034621 [Populus alba x Populus x berolinensis]|uniref:Uncharacterized protein n=1 Tax=Populus alba x Populus x berolinensis TaxID=444605 RepID=A0AAD6PXC1_9ROSI|nr:hypothetical protein NC653_034621 [Populus alba x Populus x berolinensis]
MNKNILEGAKKINKIPEAREQTIHRITRTKKKEGEKCSAGQSSLMFSFSKLSGE